MQGKIFASCQQRSSHDVYKGALRRGQRDRFERWAVHPWLPEFTVTQNCQRATTEELRARLHCYGVFASGSRPQLVERLLLITQAVFNLLNEWSELPRVPVDRNFPFPIARLRSAAEVNRAWAQCHGESHPAIQHDGHQSGADQATEAPQSPAQTKRPQVNEDPEAPQSPAQTKRQRSLECPWMTWYSHHRRPGSGDSR